MDLGRCETPALHAGTVSSGTGSSSEQGWQHVPMLLAIWRDGSPGQAVDSQTPNTALSLTRVTSCSGTHLAQKETRSLAHEKRQNWLLPPHPTAGVEIRS